MHNGHVPNAFSERARRFQKFQQFQDNQEGLKKGSIMSFNDQEGSRMSLNVNKCSIMFIRVQQYPRCS